MALQADEHWMRRALEIAIPGRGRVEPNPLVGCVIVRDGRVIGEGFHERFGGPHAEPNALAACREDPAGATAYTTLEPCCHRGKKTPPCVPRLIEAKLGRVVVGCLDANPKVGGEGVRQLREAGLAVDVGVLEPQCRQFIAPFIAFTTHRRPYVTLKWAQSADGRIAGRLGRPVRITNDPATAAVHALRGRCDAIAVGTNTVRNDDPLLTARTTDPPRTPIRVVLSNRLSLPRQRRLFESREGGPVIIYTASAADSPAARELTAAGVEVFPLPARDNGRGEERFLMSDVYADLHRRGVTHLLIEPGAKLSRELIARNQADRAWVIRGQIEIGEDGIEATPCPWPSVGSVDLDGDRLIEHLNPRSACFFAPDASPDLLLASPRQQRP